MDITNVVNTWLSDSYDSKTREEVGRLLRENPDELKDSFYRSLEFGTGGLRGIMGVGPNRMNQYSVGAATQGLANYLKKSYPDTSLKVVVAYDSRLNSRYFAEVTAEVMAANGIFCYLFSELRPTPELSFAVRFLQCQAGVMVTASHNPKEYNGYKVYWTDGGQIVPPHDKGIMQEVNAVTSVQQINRVSNKNLIQLIDKEVDEPYLSQIEALSLNPISIQRHKTLKIVYTPLHGTGITMIPEALRRFGFTNVTIVEAQKTPDGNFPTVASPNPEEKTAMALALQKADEIQADLILATDPDADRMGIGVRNKRGEMELLNGNMTGALLIDYLLTQWQKQGKLTGKEFIVKTIVTTELIKEIAESYGVPCFDVLTGFKYIAEKIRTSSEQIFIAGGEESYGYLIGDFVRDKDAVSACCMIAEMAAYLADSDSSLYEQLLKLYQHYHFYLEHLFSLTKKGQTGAEEIKQIMEDFRTTPPVAIYEVPVVKMVDYKESCAKKYENGALLEVEPISLPKSDVLQFILADGSKITVRPSGTEPKIKFYISLCTSILSLTDFEKTKEMLLERIEALENLLKL